jgi:hypothetical protein
MDAADKGVAISNGIGALIVLVSMIITPFFSRSIGEGIFTGLAVGLVLWIAFVFLSILVGMIIRALDAISKD